MSLCISSNHLSLRMEGQIHGKIPVSQGNLGISFDYERTFPLVVALQILLGEWRRG